MPECIIASAGEQDILRVMLAMRPEHVREITESSGLDKEAAVRLSVQDSTLVMAGRVDGHTLFILGVSKKPLLSESGSVWMLATPAIDEHDLEVAGALRRLFGRVYSLTLSKRLEQWVPTWYGKGIKFMQWLGWEQKGVETINGIEHAHMIHIKEAGK